jgi:hypothetical protein
MNVSRAIAPPRHRATSTSVSRRAAGLAEMHRLCAALHCTPLQLEMAVRLVGTSEAALRDWFGG